MADAKLSAKLLTTATRKLWWVIVLGTILSAVGAYGYSSLQVPMYRSTATLYFALNQGTSASDLNQGSAYTQSQMLSFAQLATSSRVLGPVIEELELDTSPQALARSVDVSIPQSTVTLRITATTASAERSSVLANAVANQLIEVVLDVAPKTPEGTSSISAQIVDDAVPPQFQFSPNKPRDALLGGFLGGVVGLGLVLLIAVLDTRLRSEEILAQAGGDPVLGVVSKSPLLATRGIAVAREPLGHTSEEFRRIRSALTYANISERVRVLLVTSALPGEGKSTVSVNLATTLSALQQSVLLVDADLRRPRAHEHAGIDGSVGLTDLLLTDVEAEVAKHTVADTTLDVLPSGGIPPNPAQMLTSDPMAELISTASEDYDWVVIDTPPVLSVADAGLLAPLADGVILVVNAKTGRATLTKCMRSLDSSGARILGTVLNGARPDRRHKEYYIE